jgi:hypothetical protein
LISLGPLEQYASLVTLVLLFIDGAIFGLAIKKGFTSILLIVIGLILATLVGLVIPYLSLASVLNFVASLVASEISRVGTLFVAFPILWILGLLVGIWMG